MKISSSYRLSAEAKAKIAALSEQLELNHTQVLEIIIRETEVISRPEIKTVIVKGDK